LAFTSGDVATPASPIPPERESGDIRRKGTAVGIADELVPFVFVPPLPICENAIDGDKSRKKKKIFLALRALNFIAAI